MEDAAGHAAAGAAPLPAHIEAPSFRGAPPRRACERNQERARHPLHLSIRVWRENAASGATLKENQAPSFEGARERRASGGSLSMARWRGAPSC